MWGPCSVASHPLAGKETPGALPDEPKPTSRPARLSHEEGHELFDYAAREIAGMSGPEFLARYDAGKSNDLSEETPEGFNLQHLIMLIPFGRQDS